MPNGAHASATYGSHISPNHRRTRKSHKLRNTLLIVLLALVAFSAAAGVAGVKFYKEAMQVKDHETQAVEVIKTLKGSDHSNLSDTLDRSIPQFQQHAAAARAITDGALWKLAEKIPYYGNDITTIRGMTQVVDDIASKALPELRDNINNLFNANLSAGDSQLNLKPIEDARASFNDTNRIIQEQCTKLTSLPEPKIGMVKTAYDQATEQFTTISSTIDNLNNSLQLLPTFLGSQGQRNYLLMAQTTSEARSVGGLIGSIGSLNATDGKISVGEFHNNKEYPFYVVDTPELQDAFNTIGGLASVARNATAVPEFSNLANLVNKMWDASSFAHGVKMDGLIVVDPVFIQEMMRITGQSITLPNGTVLNGQNTAEFMLNTIYKTVPVDQQDGYFEVIVGQMMDQIFTNLNTSKLMDIAESLGELTEQRHLYIYSYHEEEAAQFQGAGYAQDLSTSEENPSVGVYINELKSSKMDWYVKRQSTVTRTVTNADGTQTYHVSFHMTNTIPDSDLRTDYTYIIGVDRAGTPPGTAYDALLFYAPAGGSITNFKVEGVGQTPSPVTINGRSLYKAISPLQPGQSVTYEFDVTTSSKATSSLKLDQTPMGWLDSGVTYSN